MEKNKLIKIFISYSHKNKDFMLELLDYLDCLKKEGIEIWTDENIAAGDKWDDEIKKKIKETDITLALVSQAFLNSDYCIDIEINSFIIQQTHIIPVIYSACEWERHEWLKSRLFIPADGKTVEENYTDKGARQRILLKILKEIRTQTEKIQNKNKQNNSKASINPFCETLAIKDSNRFIGRNDEINNLKLYLNGGSVSLIGEPKIGKSSLIWQIANSWEGESMGVIDFQSLESIDDFYETLARKLNIKDNNWRSIRNVLKERKTILFLDELDAGPEIGFVNESLGRFRAICGFNRNFKMIVVSRHPLREIFPDSGFGPSPPFNFLQPITLNIMKEKEAELLLSHPWMPQASFFNSEIINEILSLCKGHPYKLQRAAFHCFRTFNNPSFDWLAAWNMDMEYMF